jgi:glucosamine-6-phosphate deaminase
MVPTERPRVSVYPNERGVARALAERLAEAIARKPGMVLGLPTGRTPVLLYRELALLHQEGRIDFSRVTTFNLDEFLGVSPGDPGSYRTYMQQHLFRRVNLSTGRVHFLNGATKDPEAECARYEHAIEEAGGIDLQILGIGTNGHIGFNEPARELQSHTHRVALKPETRRSNAALFGGDPEKVPTEALSMGMTTILHARSIVLLATGKSKAPCIERVINGPITTDLPASFLQLHANAELMLDNAAAGKINQQY